MHIYIITIGRSGLIVEYACRLQC